MKEQLISNPKFYIGHSTINGYQEIECLFNYKEKLILNIYLFRYKKGANSEYYLKQAKESYERDLKSGKLLKIAKKQATSHYILKRHLLFGGLAVLGCGLIATAGILIYKYLPRYETFNYVIKSDGTYEISDYKGNVANVVIPETFNGIKITSIADHAFAQHKEIKTLQLSNNLETIGAFAFSGDNALTSVTFDGVNNVTPSLKILNTHAFSQCYNLKDIYLPNSLHEIYPFAFQNDRALETLFIPRNVYKVEADVFMGCSNVTFYVESSTIPSTWSTKWNSVNRPYVLDSTRDTPSKLVYKDNLIFARRDTDDGSYAEIIGYYENETQKLPELCNIPEKVTMGNDEINVTAINANAFATAPAGNVRWLTIPASIKNIGANAFKGLTNTLVFVTKFADTSKWESGWNNGVLKTYEGFIEFDFDEDEQPILASVDNNHKIVLGGKPDAEGVLDLNNKGDEIAPKAFANREDIKSVITTATIGDFAFANCRNLNTLDYENYVENVYVGKYAFYISKFVEGQNGVTSITLKTNNNLTVDNYAFQKGSGTSNPVIENLVIGKGNTGSLKFGDGVFTNCSFEENTTITFDEHMDKPGRGLFQNADETFTIKVSNALFTKMQDEWGWPVDQEKKLSLHKSADGTYYQLYTKWPTTEPAYERFGKAHIVVS